MSSIFDQFSETDEQEEEIEETPSGEIFEQFSEKEKEKPSFLKTLDDSLGQLARSTAAAFFASPKSLADFLKFGSNFLAQKGVEQSIKQGTPQSEDTMKFTEVILKGLGFPSDLLEKIKYPSEEDFEEILAQAQGEVQKAPEDLSSWEKAGKTTGRFLGSSAVGGVKNLGKRLAFGGLGGASAAAAEASGGGMGSQIGAAFAVPAVVSLLAQIKSGKLHLSTAEQKELMEFGKKIGLSAEEMTPLLQSKKKIGALSKASKPSSQTEALLGSPSTGTQGTIGKKLGQAIDQVKSRAKDLPPATRKQTEDLIFKLSDVAEDLKLSKMPGEDKLQAIKLIEKGMLDIAANGIDPAEIISTYRDVNKSVNWNSFKGGKKDLAKIQEPFKEILRETAPEVAKDFEKLNALYSNFKKIQKSIDTNMYKKAAEYGKYFAVLSSVVQQAATGNFKAIPPTLATMFGINLSQKLATKMLIDPKYQQLLTKSALAVKGGSRAVGLKTFKELKEQIIKDFPEESKEVDWKDIQQDKVLSRNKATRS